MMSTLTMIIISRLGVFYETFRPSRFLSLCHINETFEMCVFVFASSTALFFSYVCVCVSAYAIIDLRNSPVSLFINKRPLESQYFIRNVMLALNDFFHWCWCSTQLRNNNKVPHEPNKNDIANSSNGLNFVVLMKRIYAWLKTIFLGINRGLEGKRKMEKKRRKKKWKHEVLAVTTMPKSPTKKNTTNVHTHRIRKKGDSFRWLNKKNERQVFHCLFSHISVRRDTDIPIRWLLLNSVFLFGRLTTRALHWNRTKARIMIEKEEWGDRKQIETATSKKGGNEFYCFI